jgi:Protein of unknown function (DUF3761)
MRPLRDRLVILAWILVLLSESFAVQTPTPSPSPTLLAITSDSKPNPPKPNCTNNGIYVNSKGETVKRPENCSLVPQGATAQCGDGTFSFSKSRRGTSSHHGGLRSGYEWKLSKVEKARFDGVPPLVDPCCVRRYCRALNPTNLL